MPGGLGGAARSTQSSCVLNEHPSIVAGYGQASILTADGELVTESASAAAARLRSLPPPLLVHAPATWRRLGQRQAPSLDLLELFAFVLPARPVAPTPRGLALALDLPPPANQEDAAALLPELAAALLQRLAAGRTLAIHADAPALAARMGAAGWLWAPAVLAATGPPDARGAANALRVWRRLPEWEEQPPPPPPTAHAVGEAEARTRLAAMLGPLAEQRPSQADYASAVTAAFAPRQSKGDPLVVLAEAGTGTGKTLGYVAPATLWAERNHGPVWISTFTRHLQRQIDAELARLWPDEAERRRRVVVRKGRENYLCLLNLEDAVNSLAGQGAAVVPLGLIARWALRTADGDIQGGDLPGWFAELFGRGAATGLADRRGECIHGACPHYRRCYVEHTVRRARTADLVVANHALVMAQAAWGGLDDGTVPTRYVFDEGHHVFEAADSAFSAEFSGIEAAELRRWLLGAEGGQSRARGLTARIGDLVAEVSARGVPLDAALSTPLDAALAAARALPAPGWSLRLTDGAAAETANPAEALLAAIRRQVLARIAEAPRRESEFGREVDLHPIAPGLPAAAQRLAQALAALAEPLRTLAAGLAARLDDEADTLDPAQRGRIEAAIRSLQRRAIDPLTAWRAMLAAIAEPEPEPGQRPDHVHFLRIDRHGGHDRDASLHRHPLDPTIPFAAVLAAPAHGLLITSATLRDTGEADAELSWAAAEARSGAAHLPSPAIRATVTSPFDYAAQTTALVVTDLPADDMAALAAAYRTLFLAAGGGGLGLFTAISRLREVASRIGPALEQAGIPLFAQHVDPMDNATLVDVFRTEIDSCLLGTDAMRDGVDVPGRALRLVVFERVPWPRRDILHRERRIHLSGGDTLGYDDRIARLRLRQAFGRLIRNATDRGVFVLLDRRTPTRLLSAFPPGVTVERVGLAEAVARTRDVLASLPHPSP